MKKRHRIEINDTECEVEDYLVAPWMRHDARSLTRSLSYSAST